jgi:hypothetical protein
MRRLLLALMILLLPLRGWLGDAMAMDLAAPAVQAVAVHVASAEPAHHGGAEHHADATTPPCHEDAQASAAAHDGGEHPAGHGHGHCTACQICHSVAATHGGTAPAVSAPRHAAPATAPARFASAEPRLVAKPPIS